MCKEYRWVMSLASISGMIQSLVWIALGVSSVCVYLCLLPIEGYNDENDFFRVTLIKLYFGGTKCKIDGSYLGQFNTDYGTTFKLLTPDIVFGINIAYIILSAIHFVLSITFFKKRGEPSSRGIALAWSALSLIISAVDILFTYALVLDIITLQDYLSTIPENTTPAKLRDISYIPLALALLSSRFIGILLLNFILGFVIFMDALCCQNIIKETPKEQEVQKFPGVIAKVKQIETQKQDATKETVRNTMFTGNYHDFLKSRDPASRDPNCPKSMESTTRFNIPEKENADRGWHFTPKEGYWQSRSHYGTDWGMENESYINDETEQKHPDFDHDLKNFEPAQRKIKILKPPIGKPVKVPVPPPLPPSGSCNC